MRLSKGLGAWNWCPGLKRGALFYLKEMGSVSVRALPCIRLILSPSLWLFNEGSLEGLSHDYVYLLKLAKQRNIGMLDQSKDIAFNTK